MTDKMLRCAVCGAEMFTLDAELAVATDAGPVHADCYEGPVPPGSTGGEAIAEAEEEAARRENGDVPLPKYDAIADGHLIEFKVGDDLPDSDGAQQRRYERVAGRPDYDRAEDEIEMRVRDERSYGSSYDDHGGYC